MKPLDVLLILVSILFATGFIVDQRWGPERRQHRALVRLQQTRLELMAEGVRRFEESTGRYPTSEEGLDAVDGLRAASLKGDFEPLAATLGDKEGIREHYGIPYVYENRRDVDRARTVFKASPANLDRKQRRRWSRQIDDGIYVSSIGLRHDAERVFGRAWLDAVLFFFGGVILFLAVAYIIARNQRSGDRVRGINAMILVGVAILFSVVVALTSGRNALSSAETPPAVPSSSPRADLLEEYLGVVRSFVAAGVYDGELAAERERALRDEFGAVEPRPPPEPPAEGDGSPGE